MFDESSTANVASNAGPKPDLYAMMYAPSNPGLFSNEALADGGASKNIGGKGGLFDDEDETETQVK
jgi:hypothetical protein